MIGAHIAAALIAAEKPHQLAMSKSGNPREWPIQAFAVDHQLSMQTGEHTMNGLNSIRNINRDHAASKQESERFQAQYKCESWRVFDAFTGAWGSVRYTTAREAQAAADNVAASVDHIDQLGEDA